MNFSVIIPTHNRGLQLMLTLAAFEKQTYPMDQFEIIVVNDGSTDDTMDLLRNYQPPYRFEVIDLHAATGRSTARNTGVAAAKANLIVFCDPDFLVTPDFLQVHSNYHATYPNHIVSGVPNLWKNSFTHVHPDFTDKEKQTMALALQRNGIWEDRFLEATEKIELVTPEDIRNQTDAFPKTIAYWDVDDSIKVQFANPDVAPWLMCVTRCLSMPKEMFNSVGGFYEKFQKYGLEDWELGYRLHRRGYPFVSINETIGFHQEHPSASRFEDQGSDNLRMAYELHGVRDPEFSMFSLCSPSDQVQLYKNALRIMQEFSKSPLYSYRLTSRRIREACSRCAGELYAQPDSPAHRQFADALVKAFEAVDKEYMSDAPGKQVRIKRILDRVCMKLLPKRTTRKGVSKHPRIRVRPRLRKLLRTPKPIRSGKSMRSRKPIRLGKPLRSAKLIRSRKPIRSGKPLRTRRGLRLRVQPRLRRIRSKRPAR